MANTQPSSPETIETEYGTQVDRLLAAVSHAGTQQGGPSVVLANLPGEQSDYAEKVYGKVWQHAGRTGRKLSPKLESFLLNARRPGESVGMIVPFYSYAMIPDERKSWDRIVALAGKSPPVKIVNTRMFTDGFAPTKAYDEAIDHAKVAGVEVYAYISCNGGDTDEKKIEADLRGWHDSFPGRFSGIYFDNQPMYNDSRVAYFKRIFLLAKQIEPRWKIIAATDRGCDEVFAKILEDSIICYKINDKFPEFRGWENKYRRDRFGALIHNIERLDEAEFIRAAAIFGWVYATGKPENDNPYRHPPLYLEQESSILQKLNGGAEAAVPGRQANRSRTVRLPGLAFGHLTPQL